MVYALLDYKGQIYPNVDILLSPDSTKSDSPFLAFSLKPSLKMKICLEYD